MSWKDWSRRKKAIVVFVILCLLGVIAFIIYWFGFHNKSPSVTVTPTSAAAMTRLLRSRDNELNPNNDSLVGKISGMFVITDIIRRFLSDHNAGWQKT